MGPFSNEFVQDSLKEAVQSRLGWQKRFYAPPPSMQHLSGKITCCVIFHVISVMSERLETQQELETLKAWKSSSDSEKTALSAQVASLEVS